MAGQSAKRGFARCLSHRRLGSGQRRGCPAQGRAWRAL